MKYAPLAFFMLLLATGCSPRDAEYTRLEQRLNLFSTYKSFVHDTTGFHQLPKFNYICEAGEDVKYYHVTDLNADGKPDFIYSGPCVPYPEVSIFLNTGKDLKVIFQRGGEVAAIRKTKTGSVVDLRFEGCCAIDWNTVTELIIGRDSIERENVIDWNYLTEPALAKSIKKITVSGIVRTYPAIVDHDPFDDDKPEGSLPGNQLVKIPVPAEVIQLNAVGRWRMVLYPESEKYSYIGWINVE